MIRVVIPGRPVPKARPRINKIGGVWTPSEKAEEFVAFHFIKHRGMFPEGQVKIRAMFLCNARQRADTTNLIKLVEDAINRAGVWRDDHQAHDVQSRRLVVSTGQEKTIVWLGRPGEHFAEYEGACSEADVRGI